MSLSEPLVGLIRKLKFHTYPLYWTHQRVFEFIACKTNVNDLELHLGDPWSLRSVPWRCDVTTLPWGFRYTFPDVIMQLDVINVYSLCRLNGLRRLAITMVSKCKYSRPNLYARRKEQKLPYANLIALFRSKCSQKRHFEPNRPL